MRAGIIAAGRGDRLGGDSRPASLPKALTPVGGRPLIEHVLSSLAEAEPSEVAIIINESSLAVRDRVAARNWPFGLRWIVETTPSSMHSFLRVVETLAEDDDSGPFLVSTVDAIAQPGAYAHFANAARAIGADVALAIAPPDDDDRPLLVTLAPGSSRIDSIAVDPEAFIRPRGAIPLATTGYYAVRSTILREAGSARREGLSALRLFFERLLTRGYRMHGVRVAAGIDVDRPADVRAAERFLRQVQA